MSTYNGERFLRAQLDSVLAAPHSNTKLSVRDDGSSDGTLDILRRYMAGNCAMSLVTGANIGPAKSFLQLLHAAEPDMDAYLFCDQDDVWNPEKIPTAVDALRSVANGIPAMYFSRVTYTNADDAPLGMSPVPRHLGLANALLENVARGCTIALNAAGRDLICRGRPEHPIMHDWWCYLVISVLGRLIYDPVPRVKYRLHGGNATATGSTRLKQLMADARTRASRSHNAHNAQKYSRQAAEFWGIYGDSVCEGPDRRLISDFLCGKASMAARLRLAAGTRLKMNNGLYEPIHRLSILANHY